MKLTCDGSNDPESLFCAASLEDNFPFFLLSLFAVPVDVISSSSVVSPPPKDISSLIVSLSRSLMVFALASSSDRTFLSHQPETKKGEWKGNEKKGKN